MAIRNKEVDKQIDSRFEISMVEANAMKITKSQCADCIFESGFNDCKVFGTAPTIYSHVSNNTKCPKKETYAGKNKK